jgi:N-hydroxyarylamine O-acetyltransferase
MFDSPAFDLDAYLARIGFTGRPTPTMAALTGRVLAHSTSIPFESLNPFARRSVALDIVSLQQKLVAGGRGGWCYEHNLLFGHALRAFGFQPIGLAARVLWSVAPGGVRPRTHMLIRLDVDGRPHVVDVGFGGLTLTGVLRLEPEVVQETPHEPFRLVRRGDDLVMEALLRDHWSPLYSFDLQPQLLPDYEMPNWMLQHHPESHFLTNLVAALPQHDRRYALINAEFAVHHRGGVTERRLLTSPAELRAVLADAFRIRMPAGEDIDAALARAVAATPVERT